MPYLILVCLDKSSAPFTGDDILLAVRKAGDGDVKGQCKKGGESVGGGGEGGGLHRSSGIG